jgi:hypothetical protein
MQKVLRPIVRAGETSALPPSLSHAQALESLEY